MQTRSCTLPRKRKLAPLPALLAAAVLASAPLAAEAASETLEASYHLTSTAMQVDGSYTATFDFTFTNTGLADFGDLQVRLIAGPPYQLPPSVNLEVGPLAIGETTVGSWEIQFDRPVESDVGLEFLGEADDAAGMARYLPVVIRPISIREEESVR